MSGPLSGLRIVEFAGIGPAPFGGMMLADHGADVVRIDRLGVEPQIDPAFDIVGRGRRSIALDLKSEDGVAVARALVRGADAVIEGFRPGVMERLGLGPDVLLKDTPSLVYARMTGWGQDGPFAHAPGHDINYIAVSGALGSFGRAKEVPAQPLNLVGDYGAGGMMLAFGVMAALHHARQTGEGQVVDCAMTDGVALMLSLMHSFLAQGSWADRRGANLLDGGAPFYEVYATRDGQSFAIGAIEPQFFAGLRSRLGLDRDRLFDDQHDKTSWPDQRAALAALFRTRTRDEWAALLENAGVCGSPVLSLMEARSHPQNAGRDTYADAEKVVQARPAPRFAGTPSRPRYTLGLSDTADALLLEAGYDRNGIARLRKGGGVGDGY